MDVLESSRSRRLADCEWLQSQRRRCTGYRQHIWLTEDSHGCLLELTQGGSKPFILKSGDERMFLKDGDSIRLTATAGDGVRFGECLGAVSSSNEDAGDSISILPMDLVMSGVLEGSMKLNRNFRAARP
jgi:hypothetical protein